MKKILSFLMMSGFISLHSVGPKIIDARKLRLKHSERVCLRKGANIAKEQAIDLEYRFIALSLKAERSQDSKISEEADMAALADFSAIITDKNNKKFPIFFQYDSEKNIINCFTYVYLDVNRSDVANGSPFKKITAVGKSKKRTAHLTSGIIHEIFQAPDGSSRWKEFKEKVIQQITEKNI